MRDNRLPGRPKKLGERNKDSLEKLKKEGLLEKIEKFSTYNKNEKDSFKELDEKYELINMMQEDRDRRKETGERIQVNKDSNYNRILPGVLRKPSLDLKEEVNNLDNIKEKYEDFLEVENSEIDNFDLDITELSDVIDDNCKSYEPVEEIDYHKEKCSFLKKIRLNVAKKLGREDIVNPEPCTYKGKCSGTCPVCEEEEKKLNELLKSDTLEEKVVKEEDIFSDSRVLGGLEFRGNKDECNK